MPKVIITLIKIVKSSLMILLFYRLNLEKVILTCSKHNPIGQRFFKEKMRYFDIID